jgi:hypothetical protein
MHLLLIAALAVAASETPPANAPTTSAAASWIDLQRREVEYEGGTDEVHPSSEPLLLDVAAAIKATNARRIIIEVHQTASAGDAASNLMISQRRADAVRRWLVKFGKIDAVVLVAIGYGATKPIEGAPAAIDAPPGTAFRIEHALPPTGTPVILGSLDPEIIRRIVRSHSAQIKYCYEKELTRTPGLHGKIVMKWVIRGDGTVRQSATATTTLDNANVENCLAAKIKTWTFPSPKGGGIVVVNYPFVFKQSS